MRSFRLTTATSLTILSLLGLASVACNSQRDTGPDSLELARALLISQSLSRGEDPGEFRLFHPSNSEAPPAPCSPEDARPLGGLIGAAATIWAFRSEDPAAAEAQCGRGLNQAGLLRVVSEDAEGSGEDVGGFGETPSVSVFCGSSAWPVHILYSVPLDAGAYVFLSRIPTGPQTPCGG